MSETQLEKRTGTTRLLGITEDTVELAVTLDGIHDGHLIFTGGEELEELRINIGYEERALLRAWGAKLEGCFRLRLELMSEDDDTPTEIEEQ